MIMEIDARIHEHGIRPLFQEYFEPLHFQGCVALLGRFGYVHSQGRASAAGDDENPYPVSRRALLGHDLFELVNRAVR